MIIYWANSMFSEADRTFNSACVTQLRAMGYSVFSPQDKPFNQPRGETSASHIFHADTDMIRTCDVLIACIDQETIDCGVACEIGIAWSWKKPVIAVCTDFRQFRAGEYKMYKNPYVMGCIQDGGEVVKSFEDLVKRLRSYETGG